MYTPKPAPENLSVQTIWAELNEIKSVLHRLLTDQLSLGTTYGEPQKPQNGRMYYADGVTWNPGLGEGPYIYLNGEWLPLVTTSGNYRAPPGQLTLTSYAPYVHLDVIYMPIPATTLTLRGLGNLCGGYFKEVLTFWDCGATTWDGGATVWDAYVGAFPRSRGLKFTGYAPATRTHTPFNRPIDATSLALTTYAPTVIKDKVETIGNGTLILTSSAPSVSVTP